MRGALLVALAGCYAPTYSAGTPCETECPGQLLCIDHVCRDPGFVGDGPVVDARVDAIDGPPGDVDADGVNDNMDNCPNAANPDQHDEDGDQIGDVCDPCPHLSGTAADADGDGVGDSCDPQPSIAKQQIIFFDPFTSQRSEWSFNSGFSYAGESFRGVGTSAGTAFARLNIANGEVRIITGGTVATIASTTPHGLSLSFGFDSTGSKYHYGEFYDATGSGGAISITKADGTTYTSLASTGYPGALPLGSWAMVIDESVGAQRITIASRLGGASYPTITTPTTVLTAGTSQTLLVKNADMRFDYYLVIVTKP